MKYKNRIQNSFICAALVCTTLSAAKAHATPEGNGATGGGEAVLCYRDSGVMNQVYQELQAADRIAEQSDDEHQSAVNLRLDNLRQSPQMRDLFEATRPVGLPSAGKAIAEQKTNGKTIQQIYASLQKTYPQFYSLFSPYITHGKEWRAHEAVAHLRDSTTSYFFKNGCLKVQIAYFDDRLGVVYYNARITGLMDQTNLDVLKMHEDFYRFYRAGFQSRVFLAEKFTASPKSYSLQAAIWAKHVLATPSTSDSTRALVGFLVTHKLQDSKEFNTLAVKVALAVKVTREHFWLSNWKAPKGIVYTEVGSTIGGDNSDCYGRYILPLYHPFENY